MNCLICSSGGDVNWPSEIESNRSRTNVLGSKNRQSIVVVQRVPERRELLGTSAIEITREGRFIGAPEIPVFIAGPDDHEAERGAASRHHVYSDISGLHVPVGESVAIAKTALRSIDIYIGDD